MDENKHKYFKSVSSGLHGRPKLILNEAGKQLIEALGRIMCTDAEIAACLDTTVDTLLNKNNKEVFSECKQKGMETGKTSLRRTQFKLAEKSAAMAIFLGKNYLGQTDVAEQKVEISKDEQSSLVIALKNAAKNLEVTDSDEPEGMLEADDTGRDGE